MNKKMGHPPIPDEEKAKLYQFRLYPLDRNMLGQIAEVQQVARTEAIRVALVHLRVLVDHGSELPQLGKPDYPGIGNAGKVGKPPLPDEKQAKRVAFKLYAEDIDLIDNLVGKVAPDRTKVVRLAIKALAEALGDQMDCQHHGS